MGINRTSFRSLILFLYSYITSNISIIFTEHICYSLEFPLKREKKKIQFLDVYLTKEKYLHDGEKMFKVAEMQGYT